MTSHHARPIGPQALKELRESDDAGQPCVPVQDTEGGAPLRCCLRRSEPGEWIALVSYAPLRRRAAETGARPGAYDEQGPVFVHAEECRGPGPASAGYPFARPGVLRTLRRYSADGHILGGHFLEVPQAADEALDAALTEAFVAAEVASVHVRAVEYGCFLYEVRRP
ncbi:hypothetical protein QFZ75_005041 [Streptomyces sp. V3I8]|uniref:DUF1203 domain-containing protein n=1 Tax=Streptomyces sp. V3I8 TaxID=3042279 RepID=UPI00278351A7|nr:DUF1203 domain-containing protein [Streptomyces sp. V3I8]MDQ1038625.1 hypothetical protein [Streptomyces sp. V3I8]